VRRFLLTLFLLAAFVVLGAGAAGLWWVQQPLKLPAPSVDLSVEPGTTPKGVAQAVEAAGVAVPWQLLYGWFRFSGQDRQIRAGSYEIERGVTPKTLLAILVRGEEATRSVVLVEGWNIRQVRAALAKADALRRAPSFYNTLTSNCTTVVFEIARHVVPDLPLDYRLLAAGHFAEYVYDQGGLTPGYSYAQLHERGYVNPRARTVPADAADAHAYSRAIRRGVPGVPVAETAP